MIRLGSKGLDVVKLQLALRSAVGLKTLDVIDGIFDVRTHDVVVDFQFSNKLYVDGIVGPKTKAAIDAKLSNNFFILFLHCAASPEGRNFTGEWIYDFHTKTKGWSRPGYSDVIELDGKLVNLREWDQDDNISEWEYTFGVKWGTLLNANSRHLCYIGGMDGTNKIVKDTRTNAQKNTMETYIKFNILRNPNLVIAGHNQVQPKGCPSFDVPEYLRSIGVKEYNIANWGKLYE